MSKVVCRMKTRSSIRVPIEFLHNCIREAFSDVPDEYDLFFYKEDGYAIHPGTITEIEIDWTIKKEISIEKKKVDKGRDS